MIGRPKNFNPEQVLADAMNVFWLKGYEAASLQNLLRAMKLSKSSFYQTFESKHSLFLACIEYYRNGVLELLRGALTKEGLAKSNIEAVFLEIVEEARNPDRRIGCLVMNTASEVGQRDAVVAEAIDESIKKFEALFLAAVKQGQEDGSVSADKDARALAQFLTTALAGLKNMVKAGKSPQYIKKTVQVAISAL